MIVKKISLLQALSFTLFMQLIWNPMIILQAGFQLSYAVSFSIILSSQSILSANSKSLALIKVTLIAQLGALPILLWHFHEVSIAAFWANLIFIPLFTMILLPSLIFLYLFSFIAPNMMYDLALWVEKAVKLIDALTLTLSGFPITTVVLGKPSIWIVLCYLLSIAYLFIAMERRSSLKASLIIIMLLSTDWFLSRFNPFGTVLFIDVGQGDSILIDLPWGKGTYLIDTGGALQFGENPNPFSVGKEVLWPVLRSKGITSIDKMILTHGDWDHIGGAMDLSEEVKIGEIWITPNSHEKESVRGTLDHFYKKSIPVIEKMAPYSWEAGEAYFKLIYPLDDEYEGNDDSLVVWAEFGGLSWLFTGDLEESGENEIISLDLKSDVLKVGHHGSKSSTSALFLGEVDPSIAVISAGVNNRFNHPHKEVMERLLERDIKIVGTYSHGAIEYRFFQNEGTFQWMLPYDEE